MQFAIILLTLCHLCTLGRGIPLEGSSDTNSTTLLTDINKIQAYFGQLTPYHDNAESYFGVKDVGIPDGCQVEQVHLIERHGSRFPTGGADDGKNDEHFGSKVANWTRDHPKAKFTGPLSFLNTWHYTMSESFLVGRGAVQSMDAGSRFWAQYGRVLYNATVGQTAYNHTFANGTARPKLTLRTTGQSRIENSGVNWALGFFGPSFPEVPNPTIANATQSFNWVIIPEGGTENNTLASYDSCFNDNVEEIGYIGDANLFSYLPLYLKGAQKRFQQQAPDGFTFTINDTYALQSICAYEYNYLYSSDFCSLFTEQEWQGFENTLDIEYYYDYSYGQPTGRAQGIGWLQELLARLEHHYILSSDSSVNSTIDNNPRDFPLNQKFYADFSHDDILVSILTAMSLDYVKDPPSLTEFPPNPDRHFILSNLTPFGAKLVTEVIGCSASDPTPVSAHRTAYSATQYGYKEADAPNKFIRLRLNNGILPLSTIRGGLCAGRSDELCPLDKFLQSQANAYELSNYDYVCFANYTIPFPNGGEDFDGTLNETSS